MNTSTITIPARVAALPVKSLHDELEQLLGARPTSRNKPYLQRLLAKKLVERRPARGRGSRRAVVASVCEGVNNGTLTPAPMPARRTARPRKADPRLPAVGTVLEREYEGRTYKVTVLPDALFSYRGETYKSLSTIAKVITGTIWNGFLFFRLTPYPARDKHHG
jgi:hypothetical protein